MPTTDRAYNIDVLLVEDEHSPLVCVADLLRNSDFNVQRYFDFIKALQSLESNTPALILLDVQATALTGSEIAQHLKMYPAIATIPVIFISAKYDMQSIKQAFELGIVDYIVKPYSTSELLSRIKMHHSSRVLQLQHMPNDLEQAKLLRLEVAQRRYTEAELRASKQQLKQLAGHLQTVREEERARVAREIHDELGQSLTIANLGLSRLKSYFTRPAANPAMTQMSDLAQQVDSILTVLQHAANTARSISENLRPGLLDVLGLGPAIEHHVTNFSNITGICCNLTMSNRGNLVVSDSIAIAVFRIIQEALTNVARHAQAQLVSIELIDRGEQLTLVVQDDGQGLPPESPGQSHFGLLGMRERVMLLGGEIVMGSEGRKGTRIEACIPKFAKDVA